MSGHWMGKNKGIPSRQNRNPGQTALLILSLGFPLITEVSSGIVIIVFNVIILGLKEMWAWLPTASANLSLVVISIFTGIAQECSR